MGDILQYQLGIFRIEAIPTHVADLLTSLSRNLQSAFLKFALAKFKSS